MKKKRMKSMMYIIMIPVLLLGISSIIGGNNQYYQIPFHE